MGWTPYFTPDTDTKGVGTARAVYTDDQSGAVLMVFEQRVNTNDTKAVSDYCAAAKAALAKQQTIETERTQYIAKVFAELQKG